MRQLIARFVREDEGQDLIEYAFLAAFIALAVLTVIKTVGTNINTQFSNIATQVGS
jgi:pilus assembly protein Flp/PilA